MEEMNTIKRDVYVLRNTIKIPIEVTKGTDAISFEFTVRDYNLPATAAAVAYAYHKSMKKPNSALCDVSGNVISFQPSANFFEVGMNELQIRVINEDKSLISFKEKVKCSDSMGFPDEEEEENQSLIEQIIAQSGKESGERKAADEKERSERKTADETEKSERIAADAKEKSERQKEIATERARIDQLTKMGEGSTTGDAELADIRAGNEGATYSNAGNAVRAQTKDVPVMMDNLQSPYVDISLLEQGSINSNVGSEIASSKVLRSVEFHWNKNGKITAPAGYKIAIANYAMQPEESGQMTKVYMSFENYSDSQTSSKADGDAESRRLLIKRSDGADINAEDLRGKITTNVPGLRAMDVIENLEKKIKTDTTLEKEGVAADAAETGKRISRVEGDIKLLDEDKVDSTKNIARLSALKSCSTMVAKKVDNEDGSITVTPTESYGRLDFTYDIPHDGTKRYFFFSVNFITNEDKTKSGDIAAYCWKNGENLQEMKKEVIKRYGEGENGNYSSIMSYRENQYNTERIDIGLMTNTGIPYKITKESILLVDVTDLFNLIGNIEELYTKCKEIYGLDYWEYKRGAQTAQTAQTAQIKEKEIRVEYDEWIGSNRPLKKNDDGSYTYQPTIEYGAISITPKESFKVGKKYLIIWNRKNGILSTEENAYMRAAFLTASKWDYADDTPHYIDNNDGNFTYSALTTPNNPSTDLSKCYITSSYKFYQTTQYSFKPYGVYELDLDFEVTKENVEEIIKGGIRIHETLQNHEERICDLEKSSTQGHWKGKNALVIGDSISAARKWQKKLNEMLGMNVTTHAKGGVGTIAMVDGDKGLGGDYDNETSASGVLKPLSVDDVKDKDLIVVLPAYNDRGKKDGEVGDCYKTDGSGQSTIAGIIQYTINRIYEILTQANNLTCKVLYATPHCSGRYPYIDADGYEEYPAGSGQTMETLANTIVAVGNHNNIPVCDLWHNSGSNRYTWNVFGASANPVNEQYSPYELDSTGNPVNTRRIRYQNGKAYYQKRDGQVVLETYTGSAPFPYNGDQLHCSSNGYDRLGECIVGAIISHYGN